MNGGDSMSTPSEAIARLQADGFTGNWFATDDQKLRCSECGDDADPAEVTIEHTLRFEGQSDPDDETIVFALSEPGGRKGVYSAPYGAVMPLVDAAVVALMHGRTGPGTVAG
jgi:hypothetical protein